MKLCDEVVSSCDEHPAFGKERSTRPGIYGCGNLGAAAKDIRDGIVDLGGRQKVAVSAPGSVMSPVAVKVRGQQPTATLLANGKVLIAGGSVGDFGGSAKRQRPNNPKR